MKIVINIPKEKYQVIKTAMYARVGEETAKQLIKYIKNGKPLKQEPKTGYWIMHIDDLFPMESTMECSECGEHQPLTIDDNYCPNCGAEMEEVEEYDKRRTR